MKKHINIKVTGRVQGVFYRVWTKQTADRLGITGFVRNKPAGSVYIEAEGDVKRLDKFIQLCQHGSSSATVAKIQVEQGPLQNYPDFSIQY